MARRRRSSDWARLRPLVLRLRAREEETRDEASRLIMRREALLELAKAMAAGWGGAAEIQAPEDLGRVYEALLHEDGCAAGSGHAARRRRGAFYTPAGIVEEAIDDALAAWGARGDERGNGLAVGADRGRAGSPLPRSPEPSVHRPESIAALSVCDPACGTGHFLLAALRRGFARQRLHGIDVDPMAVELARRVLQVEGQRIGETAREDDGARPHDDDDAARIVHGDALLDEPLGEGRFDLVIGNPPFVDSATQCRRDRGYRASVAARYRTARGNWDLAAPFVERALRLARPEGGVVSLVLARRFLTSDHAAALRALLLERAIESIRVPALQRAFDRTDVRVIVLTVRRDSPRSGHALRVIDGAGRAEWVEQARLGVSCGVQWSALVDAKPSAALHGGCSWSELVRGGIEESDEMMIGDLGECRDGATTAQAYRLRDAIEEWEGGEGLPPRDEFVRLVNTGTIDPGRCLWGQRPTRYLGGRWLRPVVRVEWLRERMPARAAQAARPKVLIAGLATRLEAVADVDGSMLCGKSAVQIVLRAGIDPAALCAYLNSEEANARYRAMFGGRGFGPDVMQIGARQIERLPCPNMLAVGTVPVGGGRDAGGTSIVE